MTLAPGTTLGRYQILGPLGQGGMAVVYKAFQPALERTVALKVIRRGFAEDPEFRERFTREARAIARLDHPNIVDVFDFDESDGQVFLAMQFLDGGTLKDALARLAAEGRRMDQDEAVRIVDQVARALRYAHDEGVIHRDIKPSNVMLTKRGDVVVTDFGIAKIVGGTQHTATGVGIGTPEYMSPEQGQGQPLDGRTDQYALAVMAYEMLTGTLPYTADTPFAVVLKHVRDPLPLPSKVAPEITARTEQVLLRALAKDPADRYATVSEFAEELARAVAESGGRTLPTVVTPRRAAAAPTERVAPRAPSLLVRPIAVAAAGIALLLLGGGGAAVLGAFSASTPTPTATVNVAVTTTAPPTAPVTTAPVTAPPVTTAPVIVTTPPPTTPPPPPTTARPTTPPPTPTPTVDPCPKTGDPVATGVEGTVTYNGAPVAGIQIEVWVANVKRGEYTTGADGKYRVTGVPVAQTVGLNFPQADPWPYRSAWRGFYMDGNTPDAYSGFSTSTCGGKITKVPDIHPVRNSQLYYVIVYGGQQAITYLDAMFAGPTSFTWDAVPGAVSYRVAVREVANCATSSEPASSTVVTSRSYTATLVAGRSYQFWMSGYAGTSLLGKNDTCFSAQ
jgi:serine/threonine-protein kinase